MNFRKVDFFLFLSIIFFINISCTSKYNLQKEQDVCDKICEDLTDKKIIFISEKHSDVYPILFMIENLEKFYQSGLRYLFLEAGDDGYLADSNFTEYNFEIVPPWGLYAWKYEQHLLELEIERINLLHKDNPIKVIWPEYNLDYSTFNNNAPEVLNFRDKTIQENIINVMDASKVSDKAIIFYGGAHGSKKTIKGFYSGEDEEWKTTGCYLNDYYGDSYVSYNFNYLESKKIKNINSDNVILTGNNLKQFVPLEYLDCYDNECVTTIRKYGVIYPYVFTNENINVLKSKYLTVYDNFNNKIKAIDSLLGVYYLKYQLGDNFNFSYENNYNNSLNEKKLEQFNDFSIEILEEYSEYLYSYGWLEDYLYYPANDKRINYVLFNMKKAKLINPKDIWPQYWISYFETEKAVYSGKKSDYKNALKNWEELFQNELLYASPVLKVSYKKIAMCEEKLGNLEQQQIYLEKEKNVSPLLDFDYKEYVYFGY